MRKKVVVIGGGIGGLRVVQGLKRADVDITLVDRRNHHLFQPLLYQVATAGLSPGDIAEPIRRIVSRQKNVEVVLGEAKHIDVDKRIVDIGDRHIGYDVLVVAAGATHGYFGHDEWAPFAPGLKTVADALDVRRRILLAFERAEWTTDPAERAWLMTFAVVGAGPTGVEMAGAIREIAAATLMKDFRHIDSRTARVVIVEGGDGVLTGYPDSLRASAAKQLADLGVELKFKSVVTGVDERGLQIGDTRLDASTVIWAAGVKGEAIGASLGATLDRAGRVHVQPDLSIPGHPEVFVIGDLAHFEEDGKLLPGVAQVAMQMGNTVVANIKAAPGTPRKNFTYTNLGKLATIGRTRAVADLPGGIKLSGFLAWFIWAVVHLGVLVAFRNRVIVFWKWLVAYFTYDRATRLI